MRRIAALLLALLVLLSGCSTDSAPELEPAAGASSPSGLHAPGDSPKDSLREKDAPESEPPEADTGLDAVLALDGPEASLACFLYLLEHYGDVASLSPAEREALPNRFRHILMVYEWGLHETAVEVVSFQPVETRDLLDVETVFNRYGYPLTLYELMVEVEDGGSQGQLPLGQDRWLCGFVEDNSQYIDFVQSYEDALTRLEAPLHFPEYVERIQIDSLVLGTAFASAQDLPIDSLIFYLLWQGTVENDGSGEGLTQEQLDAAAWRLMGLAHVDGTASTYYQEESGRYYLPPMGFGGPTIHTVLKAVEENETTLIYVDRYAFGFESLLAQSNGTRRVMCYTYQGDWLLSAAEVDNSLFAPIILTGEAG